MKEGEAKSVNLFTKNLLLYTPVFLFFNLGRDLETRQLLFLQALGVPLVLCEVSGVSNLKSLEIGKLTTKTHLYGATQAVGPDHGDPPHWSQWLPRAVLPEALVVVAAVCSQIMLGLF